MKVAALDGLPEGRVKTVVAGHQSPALTHCDGRYGALENRCSDEHYPPKWGQIM